MIKWYKCKCCVCKKEVSQNAFKILQPEIFVCWNCMENARQMLMIKKFAKDVSVKVDFGMMALNDVRELKVAFGVTENEK